MHHVTGVTVTAVTSPVPDAQNPNDVALAPAAIVDAHAGGVTVTDPVSALAVPLHDCVMRAPAGSANASRHPVLAAPPELRTVNDRQKPVSHVESRFTVAVTPVT